MVCTRKTKTLVSTCVILSGMTNIICLLYVGWVTNYIASVYVKVQEPISEKKLEEDKGDTLRIIERLDHLENVIKQHIQGTTFPPACFPPHPPAAFRVPPSIPSRRVWAVCVCVSDIRVAIGAEPLLSPEAPGACGGGPWWSPPGDVPCRRERRGDLPRTLSLRPGRPLAGSRLHPTGASGLLCPVERGGLRAGLGSAL